MIGNAKRVAGHITSEETMKLYYPAMYSLMKNELDQREKLRSREKFLRTYTFFDQLLNDIYGRTVTTFCQNLPEEIPYPGPPKYIRATESKNAMRILSSLTDSIRKTLMPSCGELLLTKRVILKLMKFLTSQS